MGMNRVPSLVVGVGGIGCRIAAAISDLISDEDRDYVGFVGLDTNVEDLKPLKAHKIKTIQTSDERKVRDFLKLHPEYTKWFPVNRFTVDRGMLYGAGQIRSISRLAGLAAEESGNFIPIEEEIKRIRANKGDGGNGNLTVMIVGSITGGTGAGLFLQLPYYIRKLMKNTDGLDAIVIRGMFVGPDLTANVQPSKINKDAVRVNAYACLKELNALYMTQKMSEDENFIELDYYEKSTSEEMNDSTKDLREDILSAGLDEFAGDDAAAGYGIVDKDAKTLAGNGSSIPYDYIYLIEGSSSEGSVGNVSLSNIERLVAQMVFTLMFTPVKQNALSVEDNMVLQDMEKGGMGRYSGAGLCKLVFPADLAKEYVTLRVVRDLVQEEWMYIDKSYNDQLLDARDRQKTQGSLELPTLRTAYLSIFEKAVKGGEGKLGKLYNEAYIESEDKRIITKSDKLFGLIRDQIRQITDGEQITAAAEECKLSASKMNNFRDAQSEIARVYDALEDYRKLAGIVINDKKFEIANDVFPPSWNSMRSRVDSELCIYSMLANVHPITARFFCYSLIKELEKRIGDLEKSLESLNLDEYLEKDFDPKESGIQQPDAVVEKLAANKNWVTKLLVSEQKQLVKLKSKLNALTRDQSAKITKFITESLELYTYKTLLDRMEQLAENYRLFFQTISTMIEENNGQIHNLENIRMPLGQKGVYCSKEAFSAMAAEYKDNIDLPDETKKAIFEQIYHVLTDDLSSRGKEWSEAVKERRAWEKKKTLEGIFRTAVIDTIRTDVAKHGIGIVDINIHEAMLKQLELETGKTEDNCAAFKADSVEYIRGLVESTMKMAAPMLAVSRSAMAENTETVYMALHPDCAESQMGKPSAAATKELYLSEATDATDGVSAEVLMDESFSPYEIVCYKARHKFVIEQLIKYRPDSENAKAYESRIRGLGRLPVNTADPDSFKVIVNPHLNRFWHEEGYIPSMYESQRKKSKSDTLKAFIYAMGLDCAKRIEHPEIIDTNGKGRLTWYTYTAGGAAPVTRGGKLIGNTYVDFYEAIPFNRVLKRYILSEAAKMLETMKGFSQAEELSRTILSNWFIEDLIQSQPDRDNEYDQNIFDIFLEMRDQMKMEKWAELFDGLIETIWEICAYLFDSNEIMVNKAAADIIARIYEFSKAGIHEKEGTELNYSENCIKEQKKRLLAKRYRK